MTSDRIQRRIDRLLDQADEAAEAGRWDTVSEMAHRVIGIDPSNADAAAFVQMAAAPSGDVTGIAAGSLDYVAPHLRDRVLGIRDEVVGERRTVTVLFADGVGSTAMAEHLDEEQVYTIAQGWLAVMTECVHANDGTVTQFRGDGIMALFGAPLAQEESAVGAVRAAVQMRDRLGAYGDSVMSRYGADCQFRIGLNTGPVVVGSISEDLQMDFTAIGDTVNLAARVEQNAAIGTAWCTRGTVDAVAGFVVIERQPDLVVKGKIAPVEAFELLGLSGAQTRFDAALARGLSRFVGRKHELALLRTYVDETHLGRPLCVTVVGDAGLGKSRLILELQATAETDITWFRGHCRSSGRDTPLLPLSILTRDWIGISDSMSDAEVRERFTEITATWDVTVAPFLAFLLDLEVPELASIDGRTLQAGVMDALLVLLDSHVGPPLVLLIEDVHWIDSVSASVLRRLVESTDRGFTLVLTERPGYGHALEQWSALSRVVLQQLDAQSASTLAADSSAVTLLEKGVAEAIAERAGGNPLFVEELARSFVEQGLVSDEGELGQGIEILDLPAPSSVQEVILARIDGLGDEAKSALQLASVIGREFSVLLLDQLARDPRLGVSLEVLRVGELIRVANEVPELAFMFKHALTHDVAYGTLLIERRRSLHRQAAMAIEEIYADRLGEYHSELAGHYETAHLWHEALPHLEAAARKAVQTGAMDAALQLVDRLLAASRQVGDLDIEISALRMKAMTHLRAFNVHGRAHAIQAGSVFEEVTRLLDEGGLGDAAIEAGAVASMSYSLGHDQELGDRSSRELWEQGRDISSANSMLVAGGPRVYYTAVAGELIEAQRIQKILSTQFAAAGPQARAGFSVMEMVFGSWLGDYDRGLAGSAKVAPMLGDPFMPFESISDARWLEVLNLAGTGRYEDALSKAASLLAHLERIHDVEYRSRLLNTIGWIHYEVLDLEKAEPRDLESIALIRSIDEVDTEILSNGQLNLADLRLESGDLIGAAELLDEVGLAIDNPGPGDWFGRWRYRMHWAAGMSQLHLLESDPSSALTRSDELVSRALTVDAAKYVTIGRRLRAAALLALDRLDESAAELAVCIEVADLVGNPTQRWRAQLLGVEVARAMEDERSAEVFNASAVAVILSVAENLREDRREIFTSASVITKALEDARA